MRIDYKNRNRQMSTGCRPDETIECSLKELKDRFGFNDNDKFTVNIFVKGLSPIRRSMFEKKEINLEIYK